MQQKQDDNTAPDLRKETNWIKMQLFNNLPLVYGIFLWNKNKSVLMEVIGKKTPINPPHKILTFFLFTFYHISSDGVYLHILFSASSSIFWNSLHFLFAFEIMKRFKSSSEPHDGCEIV